MAIKQQTKKGDFEYKMPIEIAKEFLKARKGEEKKMHPNDFLCKIVNEQYGLLGNCIRVIQY